MDAVRCDRERSDRGSLCGPLIMNWDNISNQVSAMAGTDEFKAFMLGCLFAVGVRIVRMGIAWLRKVDTDTGS